MYTSIPNIQQIVQVDDKMFRFDVFTKFEHLKYIHIHNQLRLPIFIKFC